MPYGTAEEFMKQLGSLGKAVAPVLQRAAPGIAQGAASGASVGGPWGALIGAGAGLASSAGKPARPAAAAPAGSQSSTGTPQTLPTGQVAAATLTKLLKNQAVRQALLSQVLGSSGSQQVSTASGASLPRGAINSLLMQLLANASEGLAESDSTLEQTYLQGESGEYLVDPASPEQQAALVLSHLESTPALSLQSEEGEFPESTEWMSEELGYSEAGGWLESEESSEMPRFY